MKRFDFSLERLLKLKRQQERLAELEQQRAAIALDVARRRVAEIQNQLAQLAESLTVHVGRTVTPQHFVSGCDMSQQLGQALVAAETAVTEAEREYWTRAEQRAAIATEAEALQSLRKQQWDVHRKDSMQAEQARLDEIGLQRWQAVVPEPETSSENLR